MQIFLVTLLVLYVIGVIFTGYKLIEELFEQLEKDRQRKLQGDSYRVVKVSSLFHVAFIPFIPVANWLLIAEFVMESVPNFFNKPLINK